MPSIRLIDTIVLKTKTKTSICIQFDIDRFEGAGGVARPFQIWQFVGGGGGGKAKQGGWKKIKKKGGNNHDRAIYGQTAHFNDDVIKYLQGIVKQLLR